jgi:phosphoribosylformylglycinamidine (FGAM) synthase-like amidotransferase family enzyme
MKSVLVFTGDGINCEQESARAFFEFGARVEIFHINAVMGSAQGLELLKQFDVFCFPGGFSFGDELKSGKILAEKMRATVLPILLKRIQQGARVIGVCNGFQVLMQLGLFESERADSVRTLSLTTNDHGQFRDFWVECKVNGTAKRSPWFSKLNTDRLWLPVRHKEGRVVSLNSMLDESKVALNYTQPINGSLLQAAGLLDGSGNVLGLMPHPEAATQSFLNPLGVTIQEKEQNALEIKKIFLGALQ